jgi:Protein of unknown function (DUF2892)
MKHNIGVIERALRAIAGLVLIALAASGMIGMWGYVGVVLVVTAALRWCPMWMMFGVNTCSLKK